MTSPTHSAEMPNETAADQPPLDMMTSEYRLPEPSVGSVTKQLEPYVDERIGNSAPLYGSDQAKELIGFALPIRCAIDAGEKRLLIADVTGYPLDQETGLRTVPAEIGGSVGWGAEYLIISPKEFTDSFYQRGFKSLRMNEPVKFGRDNPAIEDRFDELESVAAVHFEISADKQGEITIKDLDSSPGTKVTEAAYRIAPSQSGVIVLRLADLEQYAPADEHAPYGYLEDIPVHGSKSPRIAGTVNVGAGSREAISMLPEADPRITDAYNGLVHDQARRHSKMIVEEGKSFTPVEQLKAAKDFVRSIMKYDPDAVEDLASQYAGDKVVSMGEFIEKRIGLCRQQGYLEAYFLERMVDEGRINGKDVTYECNTIPEFGGRHGWATIKLEIGGKPVKYIVDPAQDFVGTREEARARGLWDYYMAVD